MNFVRRRASALQGLLNGLLLILVLVSSASAEHYWQLTLSYTEGTLAVVDAAPIQPMVKVPRTPGLQAAPVVVSYVSQWLDASGNSLRTSEIQLPLGFRAALEEGAACIRVIPETGTILIRIPGPELNSNARQLRLERARVSGRSVDVEELPGVFNEPVILLHLPAQTILHFDRQVPGPKSVTKIWDTGPDANRLVVVVLGDGYTAANLTAGEFTADAAGLVTAFQGRSPWDVAFGGVNVYRVDIESNQEGADHDPTFGILKDTYLSGQFWTFNIERLLTIDGTGFTRAFQAADLMVGVGVWDHIFVLANSTKYGGSGGTISVSSVHSLANEIILHEFGHTFGDLADEYEDPYPGFPPGDGEANVDFDFSGPGLKWLIWVAGTTPLPTPETAPFGSVVGTFEGARYLTTGIYRPKLNCLMRQLNLQFCEVCKEAHLQEFAEVVEYHDGSTPTAGTTHLVTPTGISFAIAPFPLIGLAYTWLVNNTPVQGATTPTLQMTSDIMASLNSPTITTLKAVISFPTVLVRQAQEADTLTWTIHRDCNANGVRDDADITFGTSFDINTNGIPDECEMAGCCVGNTGNVDCSSDGVTDISDLTTLIDHLFVGLGALCCQAEANTDGDPNNMIDIADLTKLIDHLFINNPLLPICQ